MPGPRPRPPRPLPRMPGPPRLPRPPRTRLLLLLRLPRPRPRPATRPRPSNVLTGRWRSTAGSDNRGPSAPTVHRGVATPRWTASFPHDTIRQSVLGLDRWSSALRHWSSVSVVFLGHLSSVLGH